MLAACNYKEVKPMFKEQKGKYLYRRQYIAGPRFVSIFENGKHVRISEKFFLTAHPDLEITEAHYRNGSIFMLGYIIDPVHPTYDNQQVMQEVISTVKTADEVFLKLADKCGRFVVIVNIQDDFRIFSDACGTRQVFYHTDKTGAVWCSSQPHLIAKQLGIEVDESIKNDLHAATLFKTEEHWYPGIITLFTDIFHLTPNHYFDISAKKTVRYWPTELLNPLSITECIPLVSAILSGIIQGAEHRFNLAFAVSCGLDSRTLLSTSKKVSERIHFFTQTEKSAIDHDPDVLIPKALFKQLGLKHDIVVLPDTLDEGFKDIMQENVFTARVVKGLNAISIHDHFKNNNKEVVVLYGNCSEITKRDRFRFPKTPTFLLSGAALAAMAQMSRSTLAVHEFAKWLSPVKKLTKYNIDILDLMHWEQRVGNWGAMTFSEYEMVFESLCPYSCRKYIEYMLRVPFKYRTKPDYRLHHEIIAANWPETLKQEINPEKNRLKKSIEDFLYKTSIYDPIKFAYLMLRKRYK